MDQILTLLKQSIEDAVLVRSERKTIKEELRDLQLSTHQQNVLRSEIFKIAASHQNQIASDILLNWVEEAIKLTVTPLERNEDHSRSYFSPGNACRDAINHQIKSAKNSLHICVFTISDNLIVDEIINAHHRKVQVKIISDNEKLYDKGSDIERLAQLNIPVKVDCSTGHMHHKFCIIDNNTLINGSYNWTRSAADRNYENIVIHQAPEIIKPFKHTFNDLWKKLDEFK